MEPHIDCKAGWFDCECKLESQDDYGYYLGQYVMGVLDFSSQYGIDYSISYTATNLIGRPTKFPSYGDYPETFTMRTYGDWWQCAPSSTREIQPQNLPPLPTHDFIVVCFEKFVVPTDVAIFETFNPGGVVRIWAYSIAKHWTCLWEANRSDLIQPTSTYPHGSRRFSPPLKNTNIITKILRIDFNHSQLNYYTEIDAIMLCGRSVSRCCIQHLITPVAQQLDNSKEDSSYESIICKLRTIKFQPSCRDNCAVQLHDFIKNGLSQFLMGNDMESRQQFYSSICISDLPFEILLNILSYLDLKSLFRIGQASRLFYDISTHPVLYGELSLKPYWESTNSKLLCTLARRATMLRKLDLSWCGGFCEVSPTEFKKFLTQRGDNLTHLRLNSCKFLNASCIETVGIVCDNLTERLDLFRTAFESELLLSMLEGNRKLKHLNLAFCGVTVNMDNIAAHLSTYNTQLVSLDMWKAHFLSPRGLQSLARCQQLEELDLGWCLREATLGDSLHELLSDCPKLKKLFLSAVRGITGRDLIHIAKLGKNLEQLDLMGILSITHESVYDILVHCTKLRLLDLSFCDSITNFDVIANWSRLFDVEIKSSRTYDTR